MSEKNNQPLEKGWRIVKFGDVVTQVKDRVADAMTSGHTHYVRGEDFVPGQIRLGGRSELGDGQHGPAFHMQFKRGDVLYVSRNPRLRKAAVADFDGICANTTYVCRSDASVLLQELLPFIMQTEAFSEFAKRHQRGSTNFYVNWSDIAPYEFALPPIDEQRRISSLLLRAEVVENTHLQLAEAAEVATTSLAIEKLHVKKLDPYRGFPNGLPRGCALTKGEDIYTPQSGNGEPGTFDQNGDCIFLKVSDFNLNDELNVATGESRYSSKKYPSIKIFGPGTIVFPKRGASIFLNKVGILRTRAALDPNLMALTLHNPEQISPEFLYWLIKAIGLYRMADVTSVPQLNHKHLTPMRFALPDAATRIEIVDSLASLRGAWKATEKRRSSLINLKKQIVEEEVG